jgi:BirA family biotin operon repressor/biotin-[acetyl-CoA-carboxylase] ligase
MDGSDTYDLSALAASLSSVALEYRPEIDSTNTWALAMAHDAQRRVPFLAIVSRQTGGRGRGSNRWWSSDGAATFSLVIDPTAMGISPSRCGRIALATGVAVAESLASHYPEGAFAVKWPNDVYLNDRKLCGILVESVAAPGSRAVIGVGININNSLTEAPADVAARAITLSDAANAQFDMTEIVASVANEILLRVASLGTSAAGVLQCFRQRCWLTGKIVTVLSGQNETQGRCQGIDDDGALILATDQGPKAINAGVIASVEDHA